MSEFDNDLEASAEEENKEGGKGKKGKGEAGSFGHSDVVVSEGFYERMGLLGATPGLVAEILQNWRHLQGEGLMARIRAFAGSKARASAHAEVEIKKGKDFALLTNLLTYMKNLPNQLAHRHNIDHRNTPSPH